MAGGEGDETDRVRNRDEIKREGGEGQKKGEKGKREKNRKQRGG